MSSDSQKLLELAGECERASGPDRSLDGLIAHAIGCTMPDDPAGWPPRYTASLDAAMTLVPEGWLVAQLRQWIDGRSQAREPLLFWQADLSNFKGPGYVYAGAPSDKSRPASGPLALCAAALRARAAI